MASPLSQERLIALARAQERFGRGDADGALAMLDAIPLDTEISRAVVERRFEYRRLFGRTREALADLREGAHPAPAQIHALVADECVALGDRARGIEHLDRAIALEPRSARLHMARADALAGHGANEEAVTRSLAAAVRTSGDSALYVGAAARIALGAGAFDDARAYAERLLALDRTAPAANEVLARLSLFTGDIERARRHGAALLDSDEATARTIFGAAHAIARDERAAMDEIDRALGIDEGAWEARTWRAELFLRGRAFDKALREADAAVEHAPGLHVSARMIRILATTGTSADDGDPLARDSLAEIADAADQLVPRASDILAAGSDPRAIAGVLAASLDAMRGNRTLAPSFVKDGRLVALRARPGPRFASRALLEAVATADVEARLSAFDPIIAAHPGTGLPLCHRGELRLWLGDYAGARADLEATIAAHPRTRWAYIGLATVENVEGHHERALETLALGVARLDNTAGPGVYGVRGEALRRLGRIDDAIADLEQACAISPRRLSAQMNLALAYAAKGRTRDAERVFDGVSDRAYPLLYDAAAESRSWELSSVLERALALMLGNRSSSAVTWRSRESPLRYTRVVSGRKSEIDAFRRRELEGARRVLRLFDRR